MTKKCKTGPIHWEIHSKKGSARIKKGSLETKNAGIARDERPIWADDVNLRMFYYFLAVSLANEEILKKLFETQP